MDHITDASVYTDGGKVGNRSKGPIVGKEKPGISHVTWNYKRHIEVTNCITETVAYCKSSRRERHLSGWWSARYT